MTRPWQWRPARLTFVVAGPHTGGGLYTLDRAAFDFERPHKPLMNHKGPPTTSGGLLSCGTCLFRFCNLIRSRLHACCKDRDDGECEKSRSKTNRKVVREQICAALTLPICIWHPSLMRSGLLWGEKVCLGAMASNQEANMLVSRG